MSFGDLCNCKLKISRWINMNNEFVVSCDQYKGHDGEHSAMLYHCVKENGQDFHSNYRLGRITWKDELSNPVKP